MVQAASPIGSERRTRSSASTLLRRIRRDTSVKLREPILVEAPPAATFTTRSVDDGADAGTRPSVVVDVNTELTGELALDLAFDLEGIGTDERDRVVLNLAEVYRIDGSGFVALTRLYAALLRRGIELLIRNPRPLVRRRLRDSGLHLIVPVELSPTT